MRWRGAQPSASHQPEPLPGRQLARLGELRPNEGAQAPTPAGPRRLSLPARMPSPSHERAVAALAQVWTRVVLHREAQHQRLGLVSVGIRKEFGGGTNFCFRF